MTNPNEIELKREAIMEGVYDLLLDLPEESTQLVLDKIMGFLDSQDVGIKFKKPLPNINAITNLDANIGETTRIPFWAQDYTAEEIYRIAQKDMVKTGFDSVFEPLIKEVKDARTD